MKQLKKLDYSLTSHVVAMEEFETKSKADRQRVLSGKHFD
jgi:hypothetical protein